mmetsp:Transcript_7879/g.19006  ORF Transcript_7879/g.19006 Transcript_7879/m.19006 type:complete len:481 (+) Transcript_7879:51-1493(+)
MFIKKSFVLLFASVALSASSVTAGSVRGVTKEDDTATVTRRRNLKDENKNKTRPGSTPVVVVPVAPPAPVAPPTPSGTELWVRRCMTSNFESCIRSGNGSLDGCTNCLYGQSQLSSTSNSGVNSCGRLLCGGCTNEAVAFFECGNGNAPANPPPVTTLPEPPVTTLPANPVQPDLIETPSDYTSTGCPASASSGDSCLVPAPFAYQQCDYPSTGLRCNCVSGQFICNPTPVVGTPVQTTPSVQPPTDIFVADPITPVLPPGPSACSQTLPQSGDTCSTGGAPWLYCCYNIDTGPASAALVCSCLDGENRYLCNVGSTSQCTSIITPGVALPPPVAEPVPVTVADPVPVTVADPVPVTVAEEEFVDVLQPFCQLDNIPNDGDSCAGVLPEPTMIMATCGFNHTSTDADGVVTASMKRCRCFASTAVWSCEGDIPPTPTNPIENPPVTLPEGTPENLPEGTPETLPELGLVRGLKEHRQSPK